MIHAENSGGPRIACASLVAQTPPTVSAVADFGALGTITMTANGLGATKVAMALTGVTNQPNKWHVHTDPKTSDCASTGGHYNPFGVDLTAGSGYCGSGADVDCEVGDMSGKHGRLSTPNVAAQYSNKSGETSRKSL